jgi:hypothetical protein
LYGDLKSKQRSIGKYTPPPGGEISADTKKYEKAKRKRGKMQKKKE